MQRISKADKETLKTLQRKKANGNLDDNMQPYLRYLEGSRDPKEQYPEFYQACQDVRKSGLNNTEIANIVGLSVSSIQKIRGLEYGGVSAEFCTVVSEKLNNYD